jgi:hypothetical protein
MGLGARSHLGSRDDAEALAEGQRAGKDKNNTMRYRVKRFPDIIK